MLAMEYYIKRFSALFCLVAVLTSNGADAADITGFSQVQATDVSITSAITAGLTAVTTISLAENFGTGTITTITAVGGTDGTVTYVSDNAAVTIGNTDGVVTVTALDFDTTPSIVAIITSAETNSATLELTITVTDINDIMPVFSPASYAETVTDGSSAGTTITTVTGSDGDGADYNTVSYAIDAGNKETVFEVTSAGVIKIAASKAVDRATLKAYALVVHVLDAGTPSGTGGAAQQTGTTTVVIGVCSNAQAATVSLVLILLAVAITLLS